MAGMRDIVIHDYDKIDFEILPELQAILNKL